MIRRRDATEKLAQLIYPASKMCLLRPPSFSNEHLLDTLTSFWTGGDFAGTPPNKDLHSNSPLLFPNKGTWLAKNRPMFVRPSSRSVHPILQLDLSTIAKEARVQGRHTADGHSAFRDNLLCHLDDVAQKYNVHVDVAESPGTGQEIRSAVDSLLAGLEQETGAYLFVSQA
jgi:hypothetical protein